MQIATALITLALCGGFLWWFRRSESKKKLRRSSEEDEERKAAAEKTAQDFVNAKDLGEKCLYTLDGLIFVYIKVEGINPELYSTAEQKALCRQLSSALSTVKRPFKFNAVSRPADISKPLQDYDELIRSADAGRRKLLKMEQADLTERVMSGESSERLHYISIWDTVQRADERSMTAAANEIVKKFAEAGIHAELLDRKGIVRLCNLVNIPAYVHIESTNIEDAVAVLADR